MTMLTSCASGAIIIINTLLRMLLVKFSNFELPQNHTALNSSIVTKTTLALFINTGFILVLVNADFSQGFFKSILSFDWEWYRTVGTAIMLAMCINVLSPHLARVFTAWARAIYRTFCWRCNARSQEDLNEFYRDPKFQLAGELAQQLNTISVGLVYCAGIPIMLPVCALTLGIVYLCDRYVLLRHSYFVFCFVTCLTFARFCFQQISSF